MRGSSTPRSGFFRRTKQRVQRHGWPWLPWNQAWRADLSAYADDELPPADRARVEARVDGSPERREWLAEIEQVQESLAILSTPELPRSFELSEPQFAAALATDAEPIDERAASTRAIPLRLATAGAVASLVALATISGFDMLNNPSGSAPLAAAPEPAATEVTTGGGGSAQSSPVAAAQQSAQSELEAQQTEPAATVAAASSDETAQDASAAPPASSSDASESESAAAQAPEEAEAEQVEAFEQAQEQQQAQQAMANDSPPAITAEQQEAARDPARGAVTAGISSDRAQQSESSDPTISAVRDSEQPEAEAAESVAEPTAEPSAPAVQSQSEATPAAEPQSQPAADAVADAADDQPAEPQAARVAPESSTESGQTARQAALPDARQRTVHRDSVRSADPDDWPIPARPDAASARSGDPSWETPVQIALAVIAVTAILIWAFLWTLSRRRAI